MGIIAVQPSKQKKTNDSASARSMKDHTHERTSLMQLSSWKPAFF
jgi:hypothetical protein